MSRSPEAKERDRLAAIARRAAKKAKAAAEVQPIFKPRTEPTPVASTDAPVAKVAPAAVPSLKTTRAKTPPSPAKPRGGARKGAGAPTGPTARMRVITFKGTDAHHAAFMAAGGGAWLRGVLDAGVAAKHIKVPK